MEFTPFNIALGISMVIGVIITVFGAVELYSLGLDWLLGVENCVFKPVREVTETVECVVDTNSTMRDLARSISLILVGIPLALFSYYKIKK